VSIKQTQGWKQLFAGLSLNYIKVFMNIIVDISVQLVRVGAQVFSSMPSGTGTYFSAI
jgi:hypothetical protein